MSNLQQNQQGFNRLPQQLSQQVPQQISQQFSQQVPPQQMSQQMSQQDYQQQQNFQQSGVHILGKEPIIENKPQVVGTQPIIENQRVVIGTQPIYEKRNVVVGQQPIVEQRPTVVGYRPITEQKDFVVGQQPIIGEKPTVVGQQPIIQQKPAIVGERILLEKRTEQPIFTQTTQQTSSYDPRMYMNQQTIPNQNLTQQTIPNQNLTQQSNVNPSHSVGVFRNGARIALLSAKDRFLGGKGNRIKLSKRRENGIWVVENIGKEFALKNATNGRYLSCDGHKLDYTDNRGEQELWRVEQVEHEGIGKYLLSNYKGDYLSEGFLGLKLRDQSSNRTYWEAESI